ncbi:MAG: K+/H+ antiporter subunit F [Gammaproteobacteria bacterium]|jgi:multicomponent K+:H+ antiporter subunit F|nr:K+/H+ antiporter subunit F [Gammaproteobacteria bacterium]NCF80843.1 K+/H+ antiporter subunit F [Pseudomonadota bacterium]
MLINLLGIAGAMLAIAMGCNIWRLLRGPDATDRVLALDTLYINAVALLVLTGAVYGKQLFYEAAILIALLGFVGTVSLAKFLLRGDIIE